MYAQVDGSRVYAYTGGADFDPAQPVVVFVHGAQHDHSVWILQSRYLAHHGRAVLALDLPGHGRSAGRALQSVDALGDWLLAALDAFGVAKASLVGHSMGSLIALDAAARAPQRVDRLALVATAFPMKVSDTLLEAARDDEAQALDLINYWTYSAITVGPGSPAPGFSIFVQNRRLMERQRRGVLSTDFEACNAWKSGFDRADSLRCPLLFVLGQRDAMTPPRAARELIERCRNAASAFGGIAPKVVEIADCGHAVMSERPDELLFALRDFVPGGDAATLAC